jgi:type IV fimbrial biogenesis protein FimT
MQKLAKGFSLIEMMVAIAIIGIALSIAVPSFTDFIGNTRIRTVAESLRNGLQLARAEAVKRNAIVIFTLNDDTSWNVGCAVVTATCPATIQAKSAKEGSSDAITLTLTGNNIVRFTSLGTMDPSVVGQLTQVDIDNSELSSSKDLRITIGAGGSVRMCDPNISATTDARYCS